MGKGATKAFSGGILNGSNTSKVFDPGNLRKKDPPKAPDPFALAAQQAELNRQAATDTAALNRPNQVDSNGTQTWSLRPGADPKNPQPGDWTVTNALNADQQGLKGQQDANTALRGNSVTAALTGMSDKLQQPLDLSGVPKLQGLTGMQNSVAIDENRRSLTADGLHNFGTMDPTTEASRQRITDAMYARQTARLDPQTQQQSSDLRSRLATQGITEGSEAYNRAVNQQSQQQADAYASARNDSIMAGGNEDSRISNQNLGVANFNNQTRGQEFGERGAVAEQNNSNIDALFGQRMQNANLNNASQIATANINNNAAHNGLTDAITQRDLGLNEANLAMGNVTAPTTNFQAYGGGGAVGAADLQGGVNTGYNQQLGAVNAGNASRSSTIGAGAGIAAAFL